MSDRIWPTIVGITAAIILLALGVICPLTYISDRAECDFAHENTGTETKFVKNHLLSWDCYVKVDGQWIPIDKWRGDSNQ